MTRYDQTLIIQFDHVVLIKKNGRFFINNQPGITTFFVQQIGYVQQKIKHQFSKSSSTKIQAGFPLAECHSGNLVRLVTVNL